MGEFWSGWWWPAATALLGFAFTWLVFSQWLHRRKSHQLAWSVGLLMYAVAAVMEAWSEASGVWNPTVYRFYNKNTHKYSYVRSTETYEYRRSAIGRKTWSYSGVAFRVGRAKTVGSLTVYRVRNKHTGGVFLTASTTAIAKLRKTTALRRIWAPAEVAYYLPRVSAE